MRAPFPNIVSTRLPLQRNPLALKPGNRQPDPSPILCSSSPGKPLVAAVTNQSKQIPRPPSSTNRLTAPPTLAASHPHHDHAASRRSRWILRISGVPRSRGTRRPRREQLLYERHPSTPLHTAYQNLSSKERCWSGPHIDTRGGLRVSAAPHGSGTEITIRSRLSRRFRAGGALLSLTKVVRRPVRPRAQRPSAHVATPVPWSPCAGSVRETLI